MSGMRDHWYPTHIKGRVEGTKGCVSGMKDLLYITHIPGRVEGTRECLV